MALAAGARKAGIRFLTGTTVVGIDAQNGRVAAVRTDKGNISCDVVVNCAGVWSRHVGHMAGVEVPVYAAEHMYVTTEEILGLPSDLPICAIQTVTSMLKKKLASC